MWRGSLYIESGFLLGSTERLKLNNEKGPQWEPHLTALVREGRGWPKAALVQVEGCGVSPAPCLLRVEAVMCSVKLCYLFKKFYPNRKKKSLETKVSITRGNLWPFLQLFVANLITISKNQDAIIQQLPLIAGANIKVKGLHKSLPVLCHLALNYHEIVEKNERTSLLSCVGLSLTNIKRRFFFLAL